MDIKLNYRFQELWDCKDRYLILWGGRGSGKSEFIATRLIANMLTHKYFSFIAIRKTYESIAETSFKTLTAKITELGLDEQFTITKSPMKIICKSNQNQIIMRGLDEVNKLKSLKDPTGYWIEEDCFDTFEDYLTVSSSLRTTRADYIQEIFTLNPMIEDYENHWFYKRFFEGHDELSFRTTIEKEINGKIYKQYATIHHSYFVDNAFLPEDIALSYEQFKMDEVSYQQQYLGLWCNKTVNNRFFKQFNQVKNTWSGKYDPNIPLHLSFDFNAFPYSALVIFQGRDLDLRQIDEICMVTPLNTLNDTLNEFKRRYPNHNSGMFIYGDSSGFASDTKMEKGVNEYSIIFSSLQKYHPSSRTTTSNPSIKSSGSFINSMFLDNIPKCSIFFNIDCKKTITDILNLKEAPDGGTLKEKFKDRESGITYERFGHISDAIRYLVCQYFKKEYLIYLRGSSGTRFGKIPRNPQFFY